MMNKKIKLEKGITLVALVVTIIVLLILASITVGTIQKGGIIEKSNDSKFQEETLQEQEIISLSETFARDQDEFGELNKENLESQLDGYVGISNYELIEESDRFIITFSETENSYELTKDR